MRLQAHVVPRGCAAARHMQVQVPGFKHWNGFADINLGGTLQLLVYLNFIAGMPGACQINFLQVQ